MMMLLQLTAVLLYTALCLIRPGEAARPESWAEEELLVQLQRYLQILSQGQEKNPSHSGLTLFQNTPDKLEGTFVPDRGQGIYFLSKTNDSTARGKLILATTEGRTLFYALELNDTTTLISITNETLLYTHSPEGDTIYAVPPSHLLLAQNAVEENDVFQLRLLTSHLREVTDEEGMKCLGHMLDFPEAIQAVAEAVNAMIQEEGVSGEKGHASRLFLAYAVHLQSKMEEESPGTLKVLIQTSSSSTSSRSVLDYYFPVRAEGATELCSAFPTSCPRGRCPGQDQCLGMCGRGCSCWRFLCGDCCTHLGCLQHDHCCRTRGFRSFIRCWVPVGFRCDRPYSC